MRILRSSWLLLLLLLASACGASRISAPVEGLPQQAADLSAPYGGNLDGVSLERSSSGFTLHLASVGTDGRFLRVRLPQGSAVASQNWSGVDNLLSLCVNTAQGAELGLVPLPGYSNTPVDLKVVYGQAQRHVSIPPVGTGSVVDDLAVEDLGGGSVGLSWTEHNQGDYNFDGRVTVTDLTPIGLFFQQPVFPHLDSSPLLTQYWVDGNHDGLINVSDLTPIGQNYLANVESYIISRNGANPIEVQRSQAVTRSGLPPTYNVAVAGTLTDSFVVAPVDNNGLVGADSTGNTKVDLRATLQINGLTLLNLDGTGAGTFGAGKFSSRVILPIDIVDRANVVGTAVLLPNGKTTVVGGIPRGGKVYLDFRYAPTVNLADGSIRVTGSVKNGASAGRSVSKNGTDDGSGGGSGDPPGTDDGEHDPDGVVDPAALVLSSVPITMPASGEVDVDTTIDLVPNTAGDGYLVMLNALINYPDGTSETVHTQLEYAASTTKRDTDNDGDFDDELGYTDGDRDCIGDDDSVVEEQDEAFEALGYQRIDVDVDEAHFISYNPVEGVIRFTINQVKKEEDKDGNAVELLSSQVPVELSFTYGSYTHFLIEDPINGNQSFDPSTLISETPLKLKLYYYRNNNNDIEVGPPTSLRVTEVEKPL